MFLTLSLHLSVFFPSLSIVERHLFCVTESFICISSPELNLSSKTNARIHSGKPSSKGLECFLPLPGSHTSFGKEDGMRAGLWSGRASLTPCAGAVGRGYLTLSTGPRREVPSHPNPSLNFHHGPTQTQQSYLDSPRNDGGQRS